MPYESGARATKYPACVIQTLYTAGRPDQWCGIANSRSGVPSLLSCTRIKLPWMTNNPLINKSSLLIENLDSTGVAR